MLLVTSQVSMADDTPDMIYHSFMGYIYGSLSGMTYVDSLLVAGSSRSVALARSLAIPVVTYGASCCIGISIAEIIKEAERDCRAELSMKNELIGERFVYNSKKIPTTLEEIQEYRTSKREQTRVFDEHGF